MNANTLRKILKKSIAEAPPIEYARAMKFWNTIALALVALFIVLTNGGTTFARESIFIATNLPAWRYDKAITIELTASDPDAKIWYTCKRNGTPADLLKYEKPFVLSKSCALVYFGYVTTELESKIERTDYTILYSEDVKLENKNQELSLHNTGTGTIDIGGWEVIAGTGSITIPPGTTVLPDASYSVGKVDPKSYALKSPEGYTKANIVIAPTSPKPTLVYVPTRSVAVAKPETVPENSGSVAIQPTSAGTVLPETTTEQSGSREPSHPIATEGSAKTPPLSNLSNLKASTVEAGKNPKQILTVLVILICLGWAFAYLRRFWASPKTLASPSTNPVGITNKNANTTTKRKTAVK